MRRSPVLPKTHRGDVACVRVGVEQRGVASAAVEQHSQVHRARPLVRRSMDQSTV